MLGFRNGLRLFFFNNIFIQCHTCRKGARVLVPYDNAVRGLGCGWGWLDGLGGLRPPIHHGS